MLIAGRRSTAAMILAMANAMGLDLSLPSGSRDYVRPNGYRQKRKPKVLRRCYTLNGGR